MITEVATGYLTKKYRGKRKERKRGGKEMGESGSLVQAAGSAAFLSPELGEQQSRNVPWREKRPKQRERKRQEGTRKKMGRK